VGGRVVEACKYDMKTFGAQCYLIFIINLTMMSVESLFSCFYGRACLMISQSSFAEFTNTCL
jgi:hypothetical protein